MPVHIRPVLTTVGSIAVIMIALLGFHLGYPSLHPIAIFGPLFGALLGGILVLTSINTPLNSEKNTEPWIGQEKLAWTLIGCGCLGWGIGECFWRYYVSQGQTPFPSLADLGYSSFSPFVFAGLFLQPLITNTKQGNASKRLFLILDSLISMGALLSIAWFLLLGSLAQTPAESALGKFLGLYYAVADIAMLSCVIFLLLRGSGASQARARRISLIVAGVGISVFASSDFLFNVLLNLGQSVDGTWVDLGWPLGMMMMGVAAYLRRFLPINISATSTDQKQEEHSEQTVFGWAQIVPYLLITILFIVVAINVFSSDKVQQSIRPVLIMATFVVIGLVIIRQIVTLLDNVHLIREQVLVNQKLELLSEEKAKRNETLEMGINYLKDIQTRLANGDVKARANINDPTIGELYPLARGMNTMADRMMRSERNLKQVDQLNVAFDALSQAFEQAKAGHPFVLPPSCNLPEIHRFLLALGIKPQAWNTPPSSPNTTTSAKPRFQQGTSFFTGGDM